VPATAEITDPTLINWPALAVSVQVLAVSTIKTIVSPSVGAAGIVGVAAPLIKYPELIIAVKAPL